MSKHYLPFKKGTTVRITQGDRPVWNGKVTGHNNNLNWLAYDLVADTGDKTVLSIIKGTIVSMGVDNKNGTGWGNTIVIKAEDGTFYRYAHLRDNPFSKHTIGKAVTIGTELGIMGNTGKSTGSHLHLERTKTLAGGGYLKISFLEDNDDILNDKEVLYSQHPGLIIQPPVTDNNTIKIGDYYVTMNNFFDPVADIAYHNGKEIIFRQGDGQVKAFLTNEKGFAFWYHHVGWADNRIQLLGGADIRVGGREELLFRETDGTVSAFLIDDNGLAYLYHRVGWADPTIKLIDSGNIDNDFLKELIFDNGKGGLYLFDMEANGVALQYRLIGNYGTNEYKVLGAGDINGDGRDEILFGGIWGNIGAFSMNDHGLATQYLVSGWADSSIPIM